MLGGFWAPLIAQFNIVGKWPAVANILGWSDGANRLTVHPLDREQADELWVSGGTQVGSRELGDGPILPGSPLEELLGMLRTSASAQSSAEVSDVEGFGGEPAPWERCPRGSRGGTQEERDRRNAELEIEDGNMDWITGFLSQKWARGCSAIKIRTRSTSRNASLTQRESHNHSEIHKHGLESKTKRHWNRLSDPCHSSTRRSPGA
jgi:hypothetical protein